MTPPHMGDDEVSEHEKPKVHVSRNGVRYVDPAAILASKRGREGLRSTTALFRRLHPPRTEV